MAEKITPYTRQELKRLRLIEAEKDYPPLEDRLVIPKVKLARMVLAGRIIIPDGPWFVNEHPNREGVDEALLDKIVIPTPAQTRHWRKVNGYHMDALRKLRLHPRFMQLVSTVGMYAGPGFSYGLGPQKATNLGVRLEENGVAHYLLNKAYARPVWGMAGGYEEKGEGLVDGAFREACEETGISFSNEQRQKLTITSTFLPPSGFRRDTMHSWMEQSFHFIQPQQVDIGLSDFGELVTNDPDEVEAIGWFTVQQIADMPNIMRSHREQILAYETSLKH